MDPFEQDPVELKVSKSAFDCLEVDFWQENDLKVTTSAPSIENLANGGAQNFQQPKKRRKVGHESTTCELEKQHLLNNHPSFVEQFEWRTIRAEIIKDLNVGEWAFDCSTLQMWWSVEIFKIFNLDQNITKPTFASFKRFLHKSDKDLALFLFQRALEKGIPYELSHRFCMPGEKVKWCRVKCKVVPNARKTGAAKLFGTIQDITLWSKSVIDGRKNLKMFLPSKQKDSKGEITVDEDATCAIS
eukprot:CAMPEP_0197529056 /NCGR_PEP_ID=MMETSP1318-20131121/27072_1 /TAXON_ID=552666 /ORGANISM="Partenskyella glossopodia, Strain RCC365" /LENGTH=243 /DNA_ID=CAMNT_0043084377 /DNA_START=71 /DNA_END=802 /DNA_ORIENTATION=-